VKISIFGMGYVGVVSAACLLRDGHDVVGVDPVESKVRDLSEGRSPIQEPGIAEMLASGHQAGRLQATTDVATALTCCQMAWVCVGTPSSADGSVNTASLESVARQIGAGLRTSQARPLVVIRSTSLPGTTRKLVIPAIEVASGLKVGRDLHVVFHPEFLREGSAVRDFDQPPKIVIGEVEPGSGGVLLSVYERYSAPRFCMRLEEAELVKYYDNVFHALKITFANEMGSLARAAGVDARRVAEAFCADTKLNISSYYLRPGFAFGGSCLPKDLRAILRYGSLQSVGTPMLEGMLQSNSRQVDSLVARVLATSPASVGMVGIAFKPNTDDMRESPYVTVAKRLIGEGIRLSIYDPGVRPDRLIGSNKEAVQRSLGHLEKLLVPSLEELDGCDVILINHRIVEADQVDRWLSMDRQVVDLVGVGNVEAGRAGYEGICW